MNKEKVQQILQIEKNAQKIRSDAKQKAKQMIIDAQTEVSDLQRQVRQDAERETEQILNQALSKDKSSRILKRAETNGEEKEALAQKNLNQAVDFVLEQIVQQD